MKLSPQKIRELLSYGVTGMIFSFMFYILVLAILSSCGRPTKSHNRTGLSQDYYTSYNYLGTTHYNCRVVTREYCGFTLSCLNTGNFYCVQRVNGIYYRGHN